VKRWSNPGCGTELTLTSGRLNYIPLSALGPKSISLRTVINFNDTPAQYITELWNGILSQGAWTKKPETKAWIDDCRFYAENQLLVGLKPTDTDKLEMT
jgi:hypothetical protein